MGCFLPRGHVTSRGRESCLHVVALGSISVSWKVSFLSAEVELLREVTFPSI